MGGGGSSKAGGIFGALANLLHPKGGGATAPGGVTGNGHGYDEGTMGNASIMKQPLTTGQKVMKGVQVAFNLAKMYLGGGGSPTDGTGLMGSSGSTPTFISSGPGGGTSGLDDGSGGTGIDPNAFGGGYALGGGVKDSGYYDVGEMGRERVWLPKGSYVQPNHAMNDGSTTYHVSVANGVTPEQMDMRMRAALEEFHPKVVQASVAAMRDHQARLPTRSR